MSGDTSVDIVWEPPTQLSSLDCWDYSIELDCLRGPEDLQLAAELGKTLLERNKELENCIKLHQTTIDDQAQEIEYMKKQTAALREVNDSRLKIYEQLEVSIQDLERANQRLALENANDKKQIKSQCLTIDTLEARVDELQKKYDQVNTRYETLLREQQTKSSDVISNVRTAPLRDGSTQNMAVSPRRTSPDDESNSIHQLATAMANDEDVTRLLQQLQEARSQRAREQKRVGELKEQLDALLHEHAQMEEQLNVWKSKAQDIKNLQDEINTLEEVRQGHLCGRCLRGTDSRTQDELSVAMFDGEEDDEVSLAESLADSLRDADSTLQELTSKTDLSEESSCNIYRELVEKYEALLKVQQNTSLRRKAAANAPAAMSLQEELQMSGEFSAFNSTQSEIESNHENGRASVASINHRREGSIRAKNKPFACTPTDFSEAETSSSGFADETSNKATQTEGRPGSFLCSIADGDDCKFSIYDDSSSLESHFHKTPEYRKLFSEIFEVLKRAAVAKAEGTELPLLDDSSSELLTPKNEQCPPFPCFTDDAPSEATDDARSIVSLAVSSVVSEPVFRVHTPVLSRKDDGRHGKRDSSHHQSMMSQQHHHHHQHQHNSNNTTPESQKTSSDTILRPIHNRRYQQLEYISVQARKKPAKKSKRLNSSNSSINGDSCPATPDVVPTPNPRVTQLKGSGRRKFRPLTSTEISDGVVWNGATAHFYPSKSPRGRHHQSSSFSRDNFATAGQDYKPGTAAEEVAKLRRLEMSYAEVLRMPNKSKVSSSRHRKNH